MSQTQISWARPLALATTLVILGSVAYWLEYSHKPKVDAQEEQSKKMFKIKDTPVASLKLVDGTKSFTFKCLDIENKLCKPGDNSKWEMTEPTRLRADDSNVNAVISSLNQLSTTETIDLTTETPEKRVSLLNEYHLDPVSKKAPGARRIEVTPGTGPAQIAFFGEASPIGDSLFAAGAQEETKVYLVPSYVKSDFEHDLTYWRDSNGFEIPLIVQTGTATPMPVCITETPNPSDVARLHRWMDLAGVQQGAIVARRSGQLRRRGIVSYSIGQL